MFDGVIDIPEAEPELTVTANGTLMVTYCGEAGEVVLRFRTIANYDRLREMEDRQRAAMGYQAAFDQVETAEYHERFQKLCAERGELAAPPLRQVNES